MPHYSINKTIENNIKNNISLVAKSDVNVNSTPERTGLPIFISLEIALSKVYSTIIVGAGIAGLYAAYKIIKNNPGHKILIIEQSSRTGGRLDTDLFVIKKKEEKTLIKEEEGGMRFTFEDMPQLMNLFVELGLDKDIVPFPMHLDDNNRRSFRGRTFSAKESARNNYQVWSDLYGIKNSEMGKSPSSIIPDLVYPSIINNAENSVAKKELKILENKRKAYLKNETSTLKEVVTAPDIWQFFRLNFKWKGIELYKWTLWSLLADMGYSNECIQMMARVSGFNGTYFSTMNAGEAFQLLMEFPAEPDFKSLRYGFSQLTNALVDKLNLEDVKSKPRESSVDILLETKVNKLGFTTKDNKGVSEIYFGSSNNYKTFDNLILALPRVALEKIINATDVINLGNLKEAALWRNLESTTNQPLAKINLYYENAWWNSDATPNANVTFGPNFSDLPLGSVYPFYTDDENVTKTAGALQLLRVKMADNEYIKNDVDTKLLQVLERELRAAMKVIYKKPAALTVYCDYQNINFWQGFAKTLALTKAQAQNDIVKQVKELKFIDAERKNVVLEDENLIALKPQNITPASEFMVNAITEYFQHLFQSNRIPKPIATSVRIWEGSQSLKTDAYGNFGYGVHQWGVGAKDDEVISYMIKPFELNVTGHNKTVEKQLPIYTCGEGYSDFQGWVEGALRSTNLVLEKMKQDNQDTGFKMALELKGEITIDDKGVVEYNNAYELLHGLRKKYEALIINS